jgi:alkanesulfonate monooxygenase SsuD/methylene tetrahydromethanopterin reductase-like flavin-dependent oxidoreductase (luciferase family)
MSDGRIELGIGAGWYETEHKAYGIPFPATKERFDRLEESLAVITGLWTTPPGERFSYDGRHYSIADSPGLPKPVQSPYPPIIVGGGGKKRTPELAARYANEFNRPFASLDDTRQQFDRVREACSAAGRDPDSLIYSAAKVVCCGVTEDELKSRADAIGRTSEDLRENNIAGTPAEVVDTIGRFAEAGAQRLYLQFLDLSDLDHLELLASSVLNQV